MFDYSTFTIADLSGGLSDNYKVGGNAKWSKLYNFISSDNRSLRTRDGVAAYTEVGYYPVRSIENIDNKIMFQAGSKISYREEGDTVTVTGDFFPSGDGYTTSADRWRNSILYTTDSDDRTVMATINAAGTITARTMSLPPITDFTVPAGTNRLVAVTVVRRYTDSDGFTFEEYSPELMKSTSVTAVGDTLSITGITYESLTEYTGDYDDVKLAVFLTKENGTASFKVGEYVPAATLSPTIPTDEVLITGASGWFLSETAKAQVPNCNYLTIANNTGWYLGTYESDIPHATISSIWIDVVEGLYTTRNYHISWSSGEVSESGNYTFDGADCSVVAWVPNSLISLKFLTADLPATSSGTLYKNFRVRPSRLVQSVVGMPTSLIASAYTDFDYTGLGISSIAGKPIVVTTDAVYRVEGSIGLDGTGSIRKVRVVNSEGGISNNSIVSTNDALYYCGTDGIYATDGFTARNITGSELYETYTNYIKNRSDWKYITGTYDRDRNIIYWRMSATEVIALALNTNSISILKYPNSYNISALKSVYNKKRNAVAEVTSAAPVTAGDGYWIQQFTVDNARRIYVGEDYRFNDTTVEVTSRDGLSVWVRYLTSYDALSGTGYLYEGADDGARQLLISDAESDVCLVSRSDMTADIDVDVTDFTLWDNTHIDMDLLSVGLNYGASSISKWVRSATFSIKTGFKLGVEPYVVVNNTGEEAKMTEITSNEQFTMYDENDIWDRGSSYWFPENVITGKRHLPKGFCRCRHNQIGLRSASTALYSSKDYGLALVNTAASTDELVDIVVYAKDGIGTLVELPYNLVNKEIVVGLNADGNLITEKLLITYQSSDRTHIRFKRPLNLPLETNLEALDWIIYGYQENQRIELMSIDIDFAPISNSGSGHTKSKTLEARHD